MAIDCGYRHIDTAYVYENEIDIGKAIKVKIDEGLIKREDMYVVSKLWNTYHRPELVQLGLEKTLENLNICYLDLYLMHWPMAFKDDLTTLFPRDTTQSIILSDIDYINTWNAMEKLLATGLVKSIGISNFNQSQIERLLKFCKIKPVINQIECHPYNTQRDLCQYCIDNDIKIVAYSPLGTPARPNLFTGEPILLNDKQLQKIAIKLKKSPAQILIRYQIDCGYITIPKATTKQHIYENFNIFNFLLSKSDMEILHNMNFNRRYVEMLS